MVLKMGTMAKKVSLAPTEISSDCPKTRNDVRVLSQCRLYNIVVICGDCGDFEITTKFVVISLSML